LASAAVRAVCEGARTALRLHRLHTGTLPDNVASQRVLEKNGFERIGYAPAYRHIAGQ